ncbi:Mss4-like protein [Geopyxis carbonaria]|nr:Mss4-like protein [Geopyxis carbonaria]
MEQIIAILDIAGNVIQPAPNNACYPPTPQPHPPVSRSRLPTSIPTMPTAPTTPTTPPAPTTPTAPTAPTTPTATLTCHCKLTTHTFPLPPSQNLEGVYTYAAAHTALTGSPFTLIAPLPPPHPPSSVLPHFCRTCGTTLILPLPSGPYLLAGALRRPALVTPTAHVALAHSPHANIAALICDGLRRWEDFEGTVPYSAGIGPLVTAKTELAGACGCGAVRFTVRLPAPGTQTPWIYNGRLAATVCFCRSCRATSGAVAAAWVFVPREHLRLHDGAEAALTVYQSSAKARRRFCRTCGAAVAFENDYAGAEMWDVAAGLLQEPWRGVFRTGWEGEETRKVDRYVNGWIFGEISFESDGRQDGLGPLVDAVYRGLKARWRCW